MTIEKKVKIIFKANNTQLQTFKALLFLYLKVKIDKTMLTISKIKFIRQIGSPLERVTIIGKANLSITIGGVPWE